MKICLNKFCTFEGMKENQTYDQKSLRAVSGSKADFDEIAKDCVAFANRDGGRLAIGIEDGEELPPQEQRIPDIISNSRANLKTTLKTIEPYRLRELILQDLKYHPRSLVSEMSERLPDIPFTDLQKCVRKMAIESALAHEGGRKYRRYSLP